MTKFTKFIILGLLIFGFGLSSYAQDTPADSVKTETKKEKKKKKNEPVVEEFPASGSGGVSNGTAMDTTDKAAGGSNGKGVKDNQNKTEFYKPDMEQKEYNFFERKQVSTPLMPRYDTDSAVYQKGKKKEAQQKAFIDHKYYYPSKPKDQWELGINVGYSILSGDVRPMYEAPHKNFGVGLSVRKALGYTLSLRFNYNFNYNTGLNAQLNQNLQFNNALNGSGAVNGQNVNYYDNPAVPLNSFFYNYRMYNHQISLDAVVSIGNIRFHKERNVVSLYLFGGVGGCLYKTKIDALDENDNVYNFTNVINDYYLIADNTERDKEVRKQLKDLTDGTYESDAESDNSIQQLGNYSLLPAADIGAGLSFHLSKWVTLSVEQKFTLVGADLMDGYQYWDNVSAGNAGGITPQNDFLSYSSVHILFNLGKNRVDPMWWLNPMDFTYKKMAEADPDAALRKMLQDTDDDGVPDPLDKEPNTEKDCPVDVKGVALDSDKDGLKDCKDKEPFSNPAYPVDSFGVNIVPPNPCCDTSRFGANGGGRPMLGPDGKPLLGPDGKPIMSGGGNSISDCSKIELPGLFFDDDKFYVDPSYQGNLHQIAERMQMCPDMKLVVTGFDESKSDLKYNEQLGWNRANTSVDYLVDKYGISRDRFVVKYVGAKKSSKTLTPYERKQSQKVEFKYANEGESGDGNTPPPHPGLKAGSDK